MRILTFLLIVFLFSFPDNNDYKLLSRNFDFEVVPLDCENWKFNSLNGYICLSSDEFVSGKTSFLFRKAPFSDKTFSSHIFQYFQLPIQPEVIKLSVYSKSQFIKAGYLKVYTFDNEENIKSRDSVSIISTGIWRKFEMTITPENAQKIFIEFDVNSEPSISSEIDPKLFLDKLELKLNNMPMNSYVEEFTEFKDVELKNINKNIELDIDEKKGFNHITSFNDHTIIGFGETIHGQPEFNKLSFNMIKYLIKNKNCRLVLFELPFELGLRINDYILGNTEENINELLSLYIYDNETISNLIQWIKIYNSKSNVKVKFLGIDVAYPKTGDNLVPFLKSQLQQSIELDSLICMLNSPAEYLKIIASRYVNENKKFKYLFKNEIYLLICQAFKNREVPFYSSIGSVNEKRDSMQFQNVKFAIENYLKENQKAVIYAHYNHINKKSSSRNRLHLGNLGKRLKGYYHDNYFPIGIFAGNGEISLANTEILSDKYILESPPINSLENLCLKTGKNVFYCDMQDIRTTTFSRSIGNTYVKNQFSPYNNMCRIEALIFFRNISRK